MIQILTHIPRTKNTETYLKYLKRSRQATDLIFQRKYHRILVVVGLITFIHGELNEREDASTY